MQHEGRSDAPRVLPALSERRRLGTAWQRLRRKIREAAFSPEWLASPWNSPALGYGSALLFPALAILLTWFLLHVFPIFALQGILPLFTALLVALFWGTGPGLLATLAGAILLNFMIFHPAFAWNIALLQPVLETAIFLAVGAGISLVVGRIEYAREEASQERASAAAQARELEAILATIADGIIVYDTQGRVRHANPAARAFNPYTAQKSYRARPFPERFASFLPRDEQGQPFTPENLPVTRALRGEVLTGELAVDTLMRTLDGEDRFSSISSAPIRDEAGNISGAVIVMRDVTERRRLAREAAERARQLSTLFETVPDAITVFDREGRIIQMNESARRLLARYVTNTDTSAEQRQAQVQPRDPRGIPFTSETSPTLRILRGETLTGEQAQTVIVRTFDGEDLWLNIAGAPLYDDEGNITGAVAVTRDLTIQQRTAGRTRSALQALLQFAEALVQPGAVERPNVQAEDEGVSGIDRVMAHLAALISQVLDYEGVGITAFGPGSQQPVATAAYGLAPDQARGWQERRRGFTIHELIVGTPIEGQLIAGKAVVIDPGAPAFSEHPTIYGSKKVLLVPMHLEGRPVGIVTCIAGDEAYEYTEEEIALARALAQLTALTLERTKLFQEGARAEAAVLALRETNRLMDEFIGIAGHELRTPLTTIKGSVELARRQAHRILARQEHLPAEVAPLVTRLLGHLDRTERQIRMQNRLISDLLDVARVHANRLELYPELCDLQALVSETVEDQQYMAPARTITLTSSASGEVLVMADEDRVRQVISNYLSNALKYSESDKPVRVRLDLSGKLVRVSVSDGGPGLSSEQQERIWERFYRVPEVEVKSGSGVGLGLGLHISRMIIERLGGHVGVESAPGKGSTFWLALPLVQVDEGE